MSDIQPELYRFSCECNTLLNAPNSYSNLEVECPVCHKINRVPSESDKAHKSILGSQPVLPLQNISPVAPKVRSLAVRIRDLIFAASLIGLGLFFFIGFLVPVLTPIYSFPTRFFESAIAGNPPKAFEWYQLAGLNFSMDAAIAAGLFGIFVGSLIGLGTSGGWGRRRKGIRTAFFTDRIVNDLQLLREVHVCIINESSKSRRLNPPLNVDLTIKFREKKKAGFEHRWQIIKQTYPIEIPGEGLIINSGQKREIILSVLSLKYNSEYVLLGKLGPYSLGKTSFWSS